MCFCLCPTLHMQTAPTYVVYTQVVRTLKRPYMAGVTTIEVCRDEVSSLMTGYEWLDIKLECVMTGLGGTARVRGPLTSLGSFS